MTTEELEAISLKVMPGQVVGLAGLLGSGRTEILQAIYGLTPLVKGEVLVEGKPVQIRSRGMRLKMASIWCRKSDALKD